MSCLLVIQQNRSIGGSSDHVQPAPQNALRGVADTSGGITSVPRDTGIVAGIIVI